MAMKDLTVLVTGVGAPGVKGTVYSLRYNDDGTKVKVVGVDQRRDAVGRYFVDSFHPVPSAVDEAYVPRLLEISKKEGVDVILPQTTREIAVLSEARNVFESRGVKLVASSAEAIKAANNKGKLLELAVRLGLPHPRFRLVLNIRELEEAAEALGYPEKPVVVKPPVSNGMRGVRILMEDYWNPRRFLEEKPNGLITTLSELKRVFQDREEKMPELLVSEYLPGPEYSVDAFQGKQAFVALPRLRKSIRSGISFEAVVENRADLVFQTNRMAGALGLQYAFGFQFKLDEDGVPKVLECNPRVQGTMIVSTLAGLNLIWWSVKETLGYLVKEEEVLLALRKVQDANVAFYRYWGGVGTVDGKAVLIV